VSAGKSRAALAWAKKSSNSCWSAMAFTSFLYHHYHTISWPLHDDVFEKSLSLAAILMLPIIAITCSQLQKAYM
jgi:hypothetical protein